MGAFLIHILISSIILGLMAMGFKFFLKLKATLDFSYLGIVIFAAYVAALVNIHWGRGILGSMIISILGSMMFTGFLLYLSGRLSDIYFAIGTFAFYILCLQLAYNLEPITGGALGLAGISRELVANISVASLESFLVLSLVLVCVVVLFLMWFKKSYFYTILQGWGERHVVIKSLGVKINAYKFTMIVITTVLAALGGSLFSFYYLYIDPPSFWLYLLMLLLIIGFVSYNLNDWGTLLVSFVTVFIYEFLRFFKFVDASKIGYMREILLSALVIIAVFWVFKRSSFGRNH